MAKGVTGDESPHLKIFSANGPRLLRSQPSPAPRSLCAWPVSHTPLDGLLQPRYTRGGLLVERT